MRTRSLLCLSLAALLALHASLAGAAPLGSAFTYQGQLQDAGQPADGSFDLQFRLFDAAQNGNQIGQTVIKQDVAVADGVFTTLIDFGSAAFAGDERYLDIAVRPGASSSIFTNLSPRQPLTATPYSTFAQTSGQTPWSGLTGIPSGFSDQVDNDTTYAAGSGLLLSGGVFSVNTTAVQIRVSGTCAAGSSIRAIASDGSVVCETDDNSGGTITSLTAGSGLTGGGPAGAVTLSANFAGSGTATTVARSDHNHDATYVARPRRTILVSPADTASASGTALLAALATITDSSCSNPYLLKLEPGLYDIGTNHLTMKECVDLEGSGEQVTTIQGTGGVSVMTGTVVGASNCELRSLTVKASGGTTAIAIHSSNAVLRLNNVTASASQASSQNFAIVYRNTNGAEVVNVTAEASGGADARGVYLQASNNFLTSVRAVATGATTNTAVFNESSGPVIAGVEATASGGSDARAILNTGSTFALINGGFAFASAATRNYGVVNTNGGSAQATHLGIIVFGGSETFGVYNSASSIGLSGLRILSFLGTQSFGVFNTANGGSFVVDIDTSVISGSTATVQNDDEFTTRIGATKLDGGPVSGNGTAICAGVHDEAYAFSPGPGCP